MDLSDKPNTESKPKEEEEEKPDPQKPRSGQPKDKVFTK